MAWTSLKNSLSSRVIEVTLDSLIGDWPIVRGG
jgi:hypothetical protein